MSDSIAKDTVLSRLAITSNIAQFVSFAPGSPLKIRHSCLHELPQDSEFDKPLDAIEALFARSPEGQVNVRSYQLDNPKSRTFLYGLNNARDVLKEVEALADEGLFTIVNETIDVNDGGFSGVALGGVVELAPDDTPRCVEKPGTLALPLEQVLRLCETVYGFRPDITRPSHQRLEFSVHPLRRGTRSEHTILWELENTKVERVERPALSWPNRYSRMIGDKAFGLLMAEIFGLRVPRTTVLSRRVQPFSFGSSTGTAETWIRTCPTEQVPGQFTTQKGWTDPWALLAKEDPTGDGIASVLSQEGVDAKWSGALVLTDDDQLVIEGVQGEGEGFMQGSMAPQSLPGKVQADVEAVVRRISDQIGPIRMEWVHDGHSVWTVQLHQGKTVSRGRVIYPGTPSRWIDFEVASGLESLRLLLSKTEPDVGIKLKGEVGITSHFGDLLRRAEVPSMMADPVR